MSKLSVQPHLTALLLILVSVIILRLTEGISADSAESLMNMVVGAIVGGGAVAVGTRMQNGNGPIGGNKQLDVNADVNLNDERNSQ